MTQYIGFSTVNLLANPANRVTTAATALPNSVVFGKKFKLTDEQLVVQDFINALNIRQGQKVGQPGYGTVLWDFIFEPNTNNLLQQIENEIRKVASLDPRMIINYINVYTREHGILTEVEMAVTPYNQPLVLGIFFNQQTSAATLLS